MLISFQLQHEQILQYHHFYHNLFTYQVSVGTLTTTVTQHRVDPTLIQATPHHNSKIARSNLTGFESHLDKALFTLNFSACSAPALNRSLLNSMLSCRLVAVRVLKIIILQFPGCNIDQETAYAASVSTPPAGYVTPPVFLITQLPPPWQATLHPTSPHTGCLPGGHCKGCVGVTAG